MPPSCPMSPTVIGVPVPAPVPDSPLNCLAMTGSMVFEADDDAPAGTLDDDDLLALEEHAASKRTSSAKTAPPRVLRAVLDIERFSISCMSAVR